MEKIVFERLIDLNHNLSELISISVNENLNYRDDDEGKRAVGTIEINGEYLKLASKERFNDEIEIDVLAPFDRLEEDERFYLEIQDFDYHIQNGNLNIEIQVLAHGVGEKKERRIVVDIASEDEKEVLKEIEEIIAKNKLIETMEEELKEKEKEVGIEIDDLEDIRETEIEEMNDEVEIEEVRIPEEITSIIEPVQENQISVVEDIQVSANDVLESGCVPEEVQDWQESESVDVEDLFDDDEMAFVTYPIYVVQQGDTYEMIADRYQVDEKRLREYNQHVSLKPHQLLVIPPR